MKRLYFVILLLMSSVSYAQENELNWLNQNAVDLTQYIPKLKQDLAGVEVLMLGEASHGTKEFYLEKNKIIRDLVGSEGYTQIGFEHLDTEFSKINDFIQGKRIDLTTAMKELRAYRTQEFVQLFQWLKKFNDKNPSHKVGVFGFHHEDFYDPFTRDKLMTDEVVKVKNATKAKVILWGHNIHTAKNKTMPEISAMGDYLKATYGKQFFNIAFDTYEGHVRTMNWSDDKGYAFVINQLPPVKKESFTWWFGQAKYPGFYVRFTEDSPFVAQTRKITNVMVNWKAPFALPTTVGKDFDALIFIRKTSESQLVRD